MSRLSLLRQLRPALRLFSSLSKHTAMPQYITGDDLAALIKSNAVIGKDYAIIDVRDDDFYGGNIVGCENLPSLSFHNTVNDLINRTKTVPKVVFHCALSQARGPKAARIYEEVRGNLHGQTPPFEVFILRGGFTQFQIKNKNDPVLVENWEKDVWESEWS